MASTLKVSFSFWVWCSRCDKLSLKAHFPSLGKLSLVRLTRGHGGGRSGGPRIEHLLTHFPTTKGGKLKPGFNLTLFLHFQRYKNFHSWKSIVVAWLEKWRKEGEEGAGRLCSGFIYRELWEVEMYQNRVLSAEIKPLTKFIFFYYG